MREGGKEGGGNWGERAREAEGRAARHRLGSLPRHAKKQTIIAAANQGGRWLCFHLRLFVCLSVCPQSISKKILTSFNEILRKGVF